MVGVGVGVKVFLLGWLFGVRVFWQMLVGVKVRYHYHWLGWG